MANLFFFFFFLLLVSSSHQQQLSPTLSPSDLQALLQIKNSLADLPGSHFFSTWDFSSPNPCLSFAGLVCSSPSSSPFLRVSSLTLGTGLTDSPGLAGTLPPAIANLSALQQLVVHPGAISGPIPPNLGDLRQLLFLSITNNLLFGPIPDSISALSDLHTLDLSYNRITGSLPPPLAALPGLKVLILAANRLAGPLPEMRSQLIHLDLKKNALSGTLPPLPAALRYLSLSENAMWGPLDALRPLSALEYLDLGMNRFSGPIPESLFEQGSLASMLLQRNNLTGGIPGPPGGMAMVGSTVDLSHNGLSGEVPTALAGAASLFLNNNRLSGRVPLEYVRSVYSGSMRTLYLQHNYLSGFPVPAGTPLPLSASLCVSYNCMVPPVGPAACPASAGQQQWRPANQCSAFNWSRAP
ncbi:hypothetical protein ACLOJK_000557 [Asimina triloba]